MRRTTNNRQANNRKQNNRQQMSTGYLSVQAPLTFTVEALSHEGRGIAHYGSEPDHPMDKKGKKIFVSFALPGEIVKAKVSEVHKKYEEADCESLISNASPDRIEPICPHFTLCGGCSLQHMHPDAQIKFKQGVLASHLKHFGELEPKEWLAPLRSTQTDYRRKARLGVRWDKKSNSTVLGFRERKSTQLTDLSVCKVLDAQVGERIDALKQQLSDLNGREHITQLEMAVGDDSVAMVVRHVKPLGTEDIQALLSFTQPLGWQLYLQPEGYETMHRIDQPDLPMRLHYELPDFNVKFAFSPLDFTQVNRDINRQLVTLACDLLNLSAGERVLDLFCGMGNFSLPLARRVGDSGRVVGVEGSQEMVERGRENAILNQTANIEFYAQDLTKDFSHHAWAAQGFDALLIDPPRAGAEEVMHYLPKFNARRIVYVSCNPATLARDAGILAQAGYRMKKAAVMDMFTHTDHVESIALFERRE